MYFDDVSRHSMQWTPPASSVSYTPSSRVIKKNSTANDDEKAEAIQRMLLGYNAETASELDAEESKCSDLPVYDAEKESVLSVIGSEDLSHLSLFFFAAAHAVSISNTTNETLGY